EFKHTRRPGIAVQLAGERTPHAAAGLELADLLLGQRLDRARLHAGIGHLRMRAGGGENHRSNDRPHLHRASPWIDFEITASRPAGLARRGRRPAIAPWSSAASALAAPSAGWDGV